MNVRTRLERLERKNLPAPKVPQDAGERLAWAISELTGSQQSRSDDNDGLSPSENAFTIFLRLAKSGEIQREMQRRGLPSLAPSPTPHVERERQRLGLLPTPQIEAIEVQAEPIEAED